MNETNRIFNLQNKLIKVKHKITEDEFKDLQVTKDVFEKQVNTELIRQISEHVFNRFKIETIQDKDNNEIRFEGSGYIISYRDMLNIILEIIDLDDFQKDNIKQAIKKELNFE